MALKRFWANGKAMPAETISEISDGLALALDALEGANVRRADIAEAKGHLRWAQRRASMLLEVN
jgi:hypothetical protein